MSNYLTSAKKTLQQYYNKQSELKQSASPEYLSALSLAKKYYDAASSAGISLGNKESFASKEASRIHNGDKKTRKNVEQSIKFLNSQVKYINSYKALDKKRSEILDEYFEHIDRFLEESSLSDSAKIDFINQASILNGSKSKDVMNRMGFSSVQHERLLAQGYDVISNSSRVRTTATLNDAAQFNIDSYKNALNPTLVVEAWDNGNIIRDFLNKSSFKSDGVGGDKIRAIDSNGRPVMLDASDKSAFENIKAPLNLVDKIKRQQESSIANLPATERGRQLQEDHAEYKKAGYSLVDFSNGIIVHEDNDVVVASSYQGDSGYVLQTNKSDGVQMLIITNARGESESFEVDNDSVRDTVNKVFGSVADKIEKAKNNETAVKTEEEVKVIEEQISKESSSPTETNKPKIDPVGTIKEFDDGTYSYVNKDGSMHTGKQGDGYEDTTTPRTYSGGGSYYSGSPVAPKAKEIYRLKPANGMPDMIFDAATGKRIANAEELQSNYKGAKEIDVPDTVKTIYREGTKIFDAKTGKQILNETELAKYKGAIEVAKPKTDEDYVNEIKAEIGGERADDQPSYSDEQIKAVAEGYKAGKYGSAREAFADISNKLGQDIVENTKDAKRKFTKIAKNEDGSVKLDEKGKPISEDFYMDVYTEDELKDMPDEEKQKVRDDHKKEFINAGGTEEGWAASDEFRAIEDVLTKGASGDELHRTSDLAARKVNMNDTIAKKAMDNVKKSLGEAWDKLTPEEQSAKVKEESDKLSIDYKNTYGKVEENVSEDVNLNAGLLPKKDDDATDTTNDDDNNDATPSNPWATHAQKLKEPKYIKEKNEDLEQKRQIFRTDLNKNRLGGVE